MKIIFLFLLILLTTMNACTKRSPEYISYGEYPIYEDDDLGLTYSPSSSVFKIWSPTAKTVTLHLYKEGIGGERLESNPMEYVGNGVWQIEFKRDLEGLFYTFQVETATELLGETPGIYVKAVGVNGIRGAIIDWSKADPVGWEGDTKPVLRSFTDIILYELHIRDITIHQSAGSRYPGKYLGLVENNTKSDTGEKTGLDHIKELGVTHVHLLPSFDHNSIDETKLDSPQFNWGYDPQNYNVPEGSYATDPYDPYVRVREFKQMVKGFHDNGIRVIMDVVYNHTAITEGSNFNLEVPGYYYRQNENGTWSDASACGNETASEREMVRKYIVESVKYWMTEYHVDGFRFDLMGIHDIETMNLISAELMALDPSLFIYGEGWTAGDSPLPKAQQALKANITKLDNVAAFSDDLRDGIKGSVFDEKSKAFVNGQQGMEENIKFGVVASTQHHQVDYQKVSYSDKPWANEPTQTISYVSCHDNHTLFDKLKISTEGENTADEIKQMHKMANAIVLTSQGIPFLHAGVEMMRTKYGEHNSYNKPDSVNQIIWDWKKERKDVFDYCKGLISLRKQHPVFTMETTSEINENLSFIETGIPNVVAYQLDGEALGDVWMEVLVIFNANNNSINFPIPKGVWTMVVNKDEVKLDGLNVVQGGENKIPALSTWVLHRR